MVWYVVVGTFWVRSRFVRNQFIHSSTLFGYLPYIDAVHIYRLGKVKIALLHTIARMLLGFARK